MQTLIKNETLILNKNLALPSHGIICAHPGRVTRIAQEFLTDVQTHTNYRGFIVYTGQYSGHEVFVANTGIGAPAAAFLIEELAAFGVRRILRLGSNDAPFQKFQLKVVEDTTLPVGLSLDYGFRSTDTLSISAKLKQIVTEKAKYHLLPLEFTHNRHIDGYFAFHRRTRNSKEASGTTRPNRYSSQDMETGALYLLSHIYGLECLSLLISYPKHETRGEYCDNGATENFEAQAIRFALELVLGE